MIVTILTCIHPLFETLVLSPGLTQLKIIGTAKLGGSLEQAIKQRV